MSSQYLIKIENLWRRFQVGHAVVEALKGVSFTVQKGEYLALMGPSGSGKSTLLHILGLLDKPTQGIYLFEGRQVQDLSPQEKAEIRLHKIGFVFQFFYLLPRLTAQDNVALPLLIGGVNRKKRQKRAREVLELVGLAHRAEHRPDQLSGGERQRVAIARAMAMDPVLLLADEPTGNLDRKSSLEVIQCLEDLNKQGLTLIVVTHDASIGNRAHRRMHLQDGELREPSG